MGKRWAYNTKHWTNVLHATTWTFNIRAGALTTRHADGNLLSNPY